MNDELIEGVRNQVVMGRQPSGVDFWPGNDQPESQDTNSKAFKANDPRFLGENRWW